MDESNGNNLFNIKISTTSTKGGNSIQLPSSWSSDDLSQSLSEYTDAEESISAPTEFLAEFLSAVMQKDYKKAFNYCILILEYEPHNTTVKEFYPLIIEKLKVENSTSGSDENYNKSSLEVEDDLSNEEDLEGIIEEPEQHKTNESVSDSVVMEEETDEDDETSKSTSESDCENEISSEYEENNVDIIGNRSNSSGRISAPSRSDNTTYSYSSLLLEEEDDIVPAQLPSQKEFSSLDLSNENNPKSSSCSESESPTEPLTHRLAAILRSK